MAQENAGGMQSLYRDIAERTQGDLYIGVVGPVRTGKSTFIAGFMEKMVLPYMADSPRRGRLVDELPQSGSGRSVMTTQPKFIPGEGAAEIVLEPGSEVALNLAGVMFHTLSSKGKSVENMASLAGFKNLRCFRQSSV